MRASRKRLVLAADADRRRIERELHDGPQQQLIALAVNLQLADGFLDADPAATKDLLEQMGRDVEQALAETTRLAQRIYPPLLDAGGLATELRSAAASVGVRARIEVAAGRRYAPEVAWTVYLCWVELLERAGNEARATITVHEKEGTLAFQIGAQGDQPGSGLERLRDRVEALGGRLKIESERVSGFLPLSA